MVKKYFTRTTLAVLLTFLTILAIFVTTSCKKEITPGNYTLGEQTQDTTTWQWQYTYNGVLPNWGSGSTTNELVGTKWVITRYNIGANTIYPNDTLHFFNNINYSINGVTTPYRTYLIYSLVGSPYKSLTLNDCSTLNGSFSGDVLPSFIFDNEINGVEFTNNFNSNSIVTVWLVRVL
jgi:hypothetical protein